MMSAILRRNAPSRPSLARPHAMASTRTFLTFSAAAAALCGASVAQTTADVAVTSGGADTVFVQPGDTVTYSVAAELGGDPSQGLAMFAFDLSFDGGDLTPVMPPAGGAIDAFVAPQGFNNPDGFGGTLSGGDLLQVGGAMNTIANTFAPTPSGAVTVGVADGASAVLASGSLVAPTAPGTYTLTVDGWFANALDQVSSGGVWSVRPAELGSTANLTIEVQDCTVDLYCTGTVNSAGCTATIAGTGFASIGGSDQVTLTLSNVVNEQFGLFVFSRGPDNRPLYNGTLCIEEPLVRLLEPTRSGGQGPFGTNCSGSFTRTIDAGFLSSFGYGLGDSLYCQWLYRDTFSPDGIPVAFSNAARITVCP